VSPNENGQNPVLVATLHLRSPEDIIYYIGQIVRLETYSQSVPRYALSTHGCPPTNGCRFSLLFRRATPMGPRQVSGDTKAAVAVTDSDGDRYIIPAGPWPPKPFVTFDSVAEMGIWEA